MQSWDTLTGVLSVSNIFGEFLTDTNYPVIGVTSGAVRYFSGTAPDPLDNPSHLEPYANKLIETDSVTYVNTSETNPIGGL